MTGVTPQAAQAKVASEEKRQTKRTFATGATRDTDDNKPDYEGFLSPVVLRGYAEYMMFNQEMADGSKRASDNWQKGIPQESYIKSLLRHTMEFWLAWRGQATREHIAWIGFAIMFNIMGWLHEYLKGDDYVVAEARLNAEKQRRKDRAASTAFDVIGPQPPRQMDVIGKTSEGRDIYGATIPNGKQAGPTPGLPPASDMAEEIHRAWGKRQERGPTETD